jgi:pimeloyl-ACP methyl ester carboxylesterase
VASVATLGTKFRWDPETAAREAGRLDPATIRLKVPRFAEALAVRHANAGGWEAVLARTADLLRDLGDHPLLTDEVLARIAQRVHVIVGERDNTVSVDESSAVARALGSGSLTVMPDTPHPIEQVSIDALVHALTAEFSDLGGGA